jgi:hypothetical protein
MRRPIAVSLSCALLACGGGSGGEGSDPPCTGDKCDDLGDGADGVTLCAAVRGNGERIPAHFASLARIVEHYGPPGAIAGGSSGSITSFLYESIASNPNAIECGEVACSATERAERIAFLLKSLEGTLEVLGQSPEVQAIGHLSQLVAEVKAQGIEELAAEDVEAAREALLAILESDELAPLINPELLQLLAGSPDPEMHVKDIAGAIASMGSFAAPTALELVRPGVIDFESFADLIGRIASFYAGVGAYDQDGMEALLGACAARSRGMVWSQAAALEIDGGGTCGAGFAALLTAYRAAWTPSAPNRADDPIGARMPVLVMTSVVEGAGAEEMARAQAAYRAGEVPTLAIDFDDVRIGYFGQSADLDRVAENRRGFTDLKTVKFLALGERSWREVLSYSPAEPGLARALELDGGRSFSAGGWPDLHPVQVLENLGCDQVVYVTRRGAESSFAQGVGTVLGMSEREKSELYDLGAKSAFAAALEQAGAVWCTDWNNVGGDLESLAADAYNAPMETSQAFFAEGAGAYPAARSGLGVVGCTPGAH